MGYRKAEAPDKRRLKKVKQPRGKSSVVFVPFTESPIPKASPDARLLPLFYTHSERPQNNGLIVDDCHTSAIMGGPCLYLPKTMFRGK